MNTTHNPEPRPPTHQRKPRFPRAAGGLVSKTVLLSAATAAAVLALLFMGAGTAQAKSAILTFSQGAGELTVHVWSPPGWQSSWCNYNADWYHSLPFYLESGTTYDLLIAPSVPENRMWSVDLNCDNGQHAHTTYYY